VAGGPLVRRLPKNRRGALPPFNSLGRLELLSGCGPVFATRRRSLRVDTLWLRFCLSGFVHLGSPDHSGCWGSNDENDCRLHLGFGRHCGSAALFDRQAASMSSIRAWARAAPSRQRSLHSAETFSTSTKSLTMATHHGACISTGTMTARFSYQSDSQRRSERGACDRRIGLLGRHAYMRARARAAFPSELRDTHG
jgi:hypothetical protein